MDLALTLCSYLVWCPLEVLAITAVLRVGTRRYPLVFAYLVVSFLGAVAQLPALWAYYQGQRATGSSYVNLYWLEEGLTDALILAVVITLIYKASSGVASRRTLRRTLALGALAYITGSFLMHYQPAFLKPAAQVLAYCGLSLAWLHPVKIGLWMAPWTRDITFCAAVLDLALWGMLIGSRKSDQRVLMLSGGMGIMFCGMAIGESLRTIAIHYSSHGIVMAGNGVEQLANILFLYVWWQTFRREAAERMPARLTAKHAVLPE